jgi:dephospho-CoA kinase
MIIGLTGGIGSGKSVVARLFEILGCAVFNSDDAAKSVYFNETTRQRVIDLLGKEAYLGEKELNKPFISKKIFSDTDLLHKLNAVIHPEVKNYFENFKKENTGKMIVKETALLFEAKTSREVDKIVLVAASDELRIKRVMARDGLSHEEVLNKIKSQLPQEEKIKLSDYVIYNNEEEFLITQVLKIYGELTNCRFEKLRIRD